MTSMNKLFSVDELEMMLDPAHAKKLYRTFEIDLAIQLLDTMRENERLRKEIRISKCQYSYITNKADGTYVSWDSRTEEKIADAPEPIVIDLRTHNSTTTSEDNG